MRGVPVRILFSAAVACVGFGAATLASAQGTFNPGVGNTTNCNVGTSGATVWSKSCSVGSVTATMTAWGFTNSVTTNPLNGTPKTGFTQGKLADWDSSGFGAYTGTKEASPQHAFDNMTSTCGSTNISGASGTSTNNGGCGGSIEALLLDFGSTKVSVTNVGIGYKSRDADLMVWAWEGTASAPTMSSQKATGSTTTTGMTAASLEGWKLVAALADMATNTDGTKVQTPTGSSLFSSYFLISTYFGASQTLADGKKLTAGDDAFKFNSFTVALCDGKLSGGVDGNGSTCGPQTTQVPEPGSLSLAAMALIAMAGWGSSQRRQRGRRA